jgi:hypothetical protein
MSESKTTPKSGRFTGSIALAAGILVVILVAGWWFGDQRKPAGQPAATQPSVALAKVSPAPRPQYDQARSPLPATPTLAGPAVTLPMPTVPQRGALAPAATIAAPGAEEIARGPHLTLSSTQFDFGQVHPTAVLQHTFIFTNTGQSELIIQQITAT